MHVVFNKLFQYRLNDFTDLVHAFWWSKNYFILFHKLFDQKKIIITLCIRLMCHHFVFLSRIFLESQSLTISFCHLFPKDFHSVNPEILQVKDGKETGGKHTFGRKMEKWQHESREMCCYIKAQWETTFFSLNPSSGRYTFNLTPSPNLFRQDQYYSRSISPRTLLICSKSNINHLCFPMSCPCAVGSFFAYFIEDFTVESVLELHHCNTSGYFVNWYWVKTIHVNISHMFLKNLLIS